MENKFYAKAIIGESDFSLYNDKEQRFEYPVKPVTSLKELIDIDGVKFDSQLSELVSSDKFVFGSGDERKKMIKDFIIQILEQ